GEVWTGGAGRAGGAGAAGAGPPGARPPPLPHARRGRVRRAAVATRSTDPPLMITDTYGRYARTIVRDHELGGGEPGSPGPRRASGPVLGADEDSPIHSAFQDWP